MPNHAEIGDREGAPCALLGFQLSLPGAGNQVVRSGGDLPTSVIEPRHESREPTSRRRIDRDADEPRRADVSPSRHWEFNSGWVASAAYKLRGENRHSWGPAGPRPRRTEIARAGRPDYRRRRPVVSVTGRWSGRWQAFRRWRRRRWVDGSSAGFRRDHGALRRANVFAGCAVRAAGKLLQSTPISAAVRRALLEMRRADPARRPASRAGGLRAAEADGVAGRRRCRLAISRAVCGRTPSHPPAGSPTWPNCPITVPTTNRSPGLRPSGSSQRFRRPSFRCPRSLCRCRG